MNDAQKAVSDRGKSRPIVPPPAAGAVDAAGVLATAGVDAAGAVAAGADVVGAGAELDVGLAVLDFFELHAAASRADATTTAPIWSPFVTLTFSPFDVFEPRPSRWRRGWITTCSSPPVSGRGSLRHLRPRRRRSGRFSQQPQSCERALPAHADVSGAPLRSSALVSSRQMLTCVAAERRVGPADTH